MYENVTKKSKALFERAKKVIPGGVCHNIRFYPPYPIYVSKAKGAKLWDVDGNMLTDFWMGHFSLILGHAPDFLIEALKHQLELGLHWGIVNELEVELAEKICKIYGCENVKFCNTGTEASMYAVRVARAYTKKNKVIKVEGGWHGANSDLSYAIHAPFRKESEGLMPETEKYVKKIAFNSLDAGDVIENTEDLACVIVEPVLGAGGFIPGEKEYLKMLREETEKKDALLVFDEVITGFRLCLGGGKEYFGVNPDLTCFGKILGGGMPVGAVSGHEEILELSKPEGKVLIGGGTFSCNPMTMRAGLETIQYLEKNKDIYQKISRLGEYVRRESEKILREKGVLAKATGVESLFMLHFLKEDVDLKSARDVEEKTYPKFRDREFKKIMIEKGFFTMHGGGAISSAHTKKDVEEFVDVLGKTKLPKIQ